jgi:hypothetical protein
MNTIVPPLIRTPLSVVKEWPYKRGGLSGRENLVVFYYLSASENWPSTVELIP